MSCNTNIRNIYLSSTTTTTVSSQKPKNVDRKSLLIQLCLHADETSACRTIRLLYPSNLCDAFGCNILMYSLRYQRYHLFDFIMNEIDLNFDFHAKDRQGNTVLHYAVLYGGYDTQRMNELIEKFKKFAIQIDERNRLGFTPLLLAVFCGRYDLVLTLLTKTDASPFVRDNIYFRNMFDYIENDKKCNREQPSYSTSELKRLRVELHETLPSQQEIIRHQTYKNFFEIILPRIVQNHYSELLRTYIVKFFNSTQLSTNLVQLVNYLNQRYPRIKTLQEYRNTQNKIIVPGENSKTTVHNILNLFDPNARPTVIPSPSSYIWMEPPVIKNPMTFKKLGTKMTTVTAFSRMSFRRKRASSDVNSIK